MWVGAVLWLGEVKQIAVINFIKKKLKEGVWNLLVFRLNQLAQGSSGPALGFYGGLLASVKTVKWAERYKVMWQPGEGGISFYSVETKQRRNPAPMVGLGQLVSSSQPLSRQG